MARHYYRTNVPLPIMVLWWGFLGVCVVIFSIYNAIVNGPKEKAQMQWDRDHFNGWRLEKGYDDQHGLLYDKLDKKTCSTKGYPGYDPCPAQQYFADGKPQQPPADPSPPATPALKSSKSH
jgi:hypothetical protein